MKNFYLVENSQKENAGAAGDIIEKLLDEKGLHCTRKVGYVQEDDIPENTDAIITLGGDGTIIRVAVLAAALKIPIIGVNIGHLGYLTSIDEFDKIPDMIECLAADDYRIEECIMLEGTFSDGSGVHTETALNDIMIGRKSMLHAVRTQIKVGEEILNEYAADGILIATPTGSSAYNLSVGGPIVQADSNIILITPICPHALTPGSILVGGDNVVTVTVTDGDPEGQTAVFDGRAAGDLTVGSVVSIKKSKYVARMIRLGGQSFISNLRKKLKQLQH